MGCSALVIKLSTIDPAAPTGRKVKAQGKAKRRPGIGVPETTQALKGRNRRRVNQCTQVSPFQGFGELGRRRTQRDGVRPRVALRTQGGASHPGWRFALPWAISLCPVGAKIRLRIGFDRTLQGIQVMVGYSRWRLPDGFMPQRDGRIAGLLNEARLSYAPTGRKGIAQGKAKRRPGIRCARNNPCPERAEPAARKSMRTGFALSGLWRIGAAANLGRWRTTQGSASLYPGLSH